MQGTYLTGVNGQRAALYQLAKLTQRSVRAPIVMQTARQIIGRTNSRDEMAELDAIYKAVHDGDPNVPALRYGLGYVHDPKLFDSFTRPDRLLELALDMANRGGQLKVDCDEHAGLIAALVASLGFAAGLRAWGPEGSDYVHVFGVAGLPKLNPRRVVALDTTMDKYAGWQPEGGHVLTAWLAGSPAELQGIKG